jgi:hypothetical protein
MDINEKINQAQAQLTLMLCDNPAADKKLLKEISGGKIGDGDDGNGVEVAKGMLMFAQWLTAIPEKPKRKRATRKKATKAAAKDTATGDPPKPAKRGRRKKKTEETDEK